MRNEKHALCTLLFCVGFVALCVTSVFAHHGSAISYDMNKLLSLKGTVTQLGWTNPHVQIYFDVKDDKGDIVQWVAEAATPGMMKRDGVPKESVAPGTPINITIAPSKAGTHAGLLVELVLVNGTVWKRGQAQGQ